MTDLEPVDFIYALHFGIYPVYRDDGFAPDDPGFELEAWGGDFHSDPNVEVEILDHGFADTRVFISGSWGCWGPADQETDGDQSLHILVQTNRRDAPFIWGIYEMLLQRIVSGRPLDYGTITDGQDHSEQSAVFTLKGGAVYVFSTDRHNTDYWSVR